MATNPLAQIREQAGMSQWQMALALGMRSNEWNRSEVYAAALPPSVRVKLAEIGLDLDEVNAQLAQCRDDMGAQLRTTIAARLKNGEGGKVCDGCPEAPGECGRKGTCEGLPGG